MSTDRYRLIDFGDGRKLESVAGRIIDRPSPAAQDHSRQHPAAWHQAQSRFCSQTKSWSHRCEWPDGLTVDCDGFQMPVRPTPFGHIGLFPEQHSNWRWLADTATKGPDSTPRAGLNLFAYTGASTMAMVSCGFQVAHVDAAKPNVQSARQAALINGWSDRPIRYLVDDAASFAAREVRRQNRYDTIVLDPPAYGHSPKGKTWRLQRDLWPVLQDCLALVDLRDFRILVTGHSPDVSDNDIVRYLRSEMSGRDRRSAQASQFASGRSTLKDESGRKLDAGFFVRVECRLES